MHTIAVEAGTSIGSMYHFFSDKRAVLDALGKRHLDAIRQLTDAIVTIEKAQWVGFDTAQVVDLLIMPVLRYIEAHPDFMLMISPGFAFGPLRAPELQADIEALYARVLEMRTPMVAEQLRRTVRTLFGLPLGLIQTTLSRGDLKRELLLEEAPLALAAYLERVEQQHRGKGLKPLP
jgi:AcrR family transcriptional regulator